MSDAPGGMPDDTRLVPSACGHSLRLLHSAVDCGRVPDHQGPHAVDVPAGAYRTALGIFDGEEREVTLEWFDDRRAATAGDLRRHLAEAETAGG